MSKIQVGKLCNVEAKRDAIHVTIDPRIAGEILHAGERVTLGTDGLVYSARGMESVGIVDPWLPRYVLKGERFYLWVAPDRVQNLRHDWTHPDLPIVEEKLSFGQMVAAVMADDSVTFLGDSSYSGAPEWEVEREKAEIRINELREEIADLERQKRDLEDDDVEYDECGACYN